MFFFRTSTVTFTEAQLTEFAKQGNVVDGEIFKVKLFLSVLPENCDLKNLSKIVDNIPQDSKPEFIQIGKEHFSQVC